MLSARKPNAAGGRTATRPARTGPQTGAGFGEPLRAVAVGSSTGVMMALVAVSYAALLYAGRLAPLSGLGIETALAGTLAFAIGAALFEGRRGSVWQLQGATVAPLAAAVITFLKTEPGLHGPALYATALALVAGTTLASGLLLLLSGAFRVGELARFIPYPVLTGFLAAIGTVLVINGVELGANVPARGVIGLVNIVIGQSPVRWAPPVGMAVILIVLAQRFRLRSALLLGLSVYLALFYALTWMLPGGMRTVQQQGLLLASRLPDAGHPLFATPIAALNAVHLAALGAQLPAMLVVPALALFAVTLNVAGLNLSTREPLDLNRALRRAGLFNLIAGSWASPPGFHAPAMTQLVASQMKRPRRLTGISAAVAVGLVLAFGMPLLRWLPAGLLGLILVYAGGNMVVRWLWHPMRRLQVGDMAIALLIVATALAFGFVPAVLLGLIMAALLFVVAYARIEVVRSVTTGRVRRSTTERAEGADRILTACGDAVRIVELQGYLFFGSTQRLPDQFAPPDAAASAAPRWVVVDFRRVHGMDISTALLLARAFQTLAHQDVHVAITGTQPATAGMLRRADALQHAETFISLDEGLAHIETRLLRTAAREDDGNHGAFGEIIEKLRASPAAAMLDPRRLTAGDVLMKAGERPDAIAYLEAGRLSAHIDRAPGQSLAVARFLPGAVIGEIGFLTGQPRTATIRADGESRVLMISRGALDYLDAQDPKLARALQEALSRLLAERLSRTTALAHALV